MKKVGIFPDEGFPEYLDDERPGTGDIAAIFDCGGPGPAAARPGIEGRYLDLGTMRHEILDKDPFEKYLILDCATGNPKSPEYIAALKKHKLQLPMDWGDSVVSNGNGGHKQGKGWSADRALAWLQETTGKIVFYKNEVEGARRMRENARKLPIDWDRAIFEVTAYSKKFKVRPDMLIPPAKGMHVWDVYQIKSITAEDMNHLIWVRTVFRYGYHSRALQELEVLRLCGLTCRFHWLVIVADKAGENRAFLEPLSLDMITNGERKRTNAIKARDLWLAAGSPAGYRKELDITTPSWARTA